MGCNREVVKEENEVIQKEASEVAAATGESSGKAEEYVRLYGKEGAIAKLRAEKETPRLLLPWTPITFSEIDADRLRHILVGEPKYNKDGTFRAYAGGHSESSTGAYHYANEIHNLNQEKTLFTGHSNDQIISNTYNVLQNSGRWIRQNNGNYYSESKQDGLTYFVAATMEKGTRSTFLVDIDGTTTRGNDQTVLNLKVKTSFPPDGKKI